MVATADIAVAAAEALEAGPEPGARVHSLHGPRDYSFTEAATAIGEGIGQPVGFMRADADQVRGALLGMGASAHVADMYLELYEAINQGRFVDEQPRSAKTTTSTQLEDFAKQVMAPMLQPQA